jgi:hypothetical protein
VTIDGPAHIENGLNTTTYRAETDVAGKFSLAAASTPRGIIVVHGQGYAEISLADPAAADKITLQPWGRLVGKVILDSRPAENEEVFAHSQIRHYDETGRQFIFVQYSMEAKTDSEGRFTFEKVPPGRCRVCRREHRARNFFPSHETSVEIKPGMVTEVSLGGGGRPVTGKAVLLGAAGPINWQTVSVRLTLKTADELGPRPKRGDFASGDAYVEAIERFFQVAQAQRQFGAFCNSDGSFRLPDTPAGTYKLEIKVQDWKLDSASPRDVSDGPANIASLVREITVPEAPAGHNDEPLDVGSLDLVAGQDAALGK